MQTTKKAPQTETIAHALTVLEDAAKEGADELKAMIDKDYRSFRGVIADLVPNVAGSVKDVRDNVVDFSKKTAQRMDRSAHEEPWKYVAGAALGALALGYLLGRRK